MSKIKEYNMKKSEKNVYNIVSTMFHLLGIKGDKTDRAIDVLTQKCLHDLVETKALEEEIEDNVAFTYSVRQFCLYEMRDAFLNNCCEDKKHKEKMYG